MRLPIAALLIPLLLAVASAQNDLQTFRVDVKLVQVDVQVLDKKTSRPVGSLTKDDFQLFEDGVPQQIARISRDQLPLSVVLLFDLTDTVRPVLKTLAGGALNALDHLKAEDEVAVIVYAKRAQIIQDFTTDREKIVAAIQRAGDMKSDDPAYFNEAVYSASELLGKSRNTESRRTIIWLTDNVPNVPGSSEHTEKEAFESVFTTGTVVSALVERSGESEFFTAAYTRNPVFAPLRMRNPPGDVNHYAERTGGDIMKSGKDEVGAKLAQLIDQIRTRYTLGYYPSVKQPQHKFCELRVGIKPVAGKRDRQLVVRTKRGYYR